MQAELILETLLLSATAVQLGFWCGIYARLAHYRAPATASVANPNLPSLSVLICARNEAHHLMHNLPPVLEQNYPHFEVIVADDDSSDATAKVLRDLQAQYPHLRIVHLSPKISPGKKAALSAAIAAAKHEWLVFTDADCRPASPLWLRCMAQRMHPVGGLLPEIVLGYGPLTSGIGLLNRCARFETLYTALQYGSFALAGMPYMGVGRNLAWRRQIFEQVGGYSAHIDLASGDDDLLVNAAATGQNTALCFEPEAFAYSPPPSTWPAWMRQKRRHLSTGIRYRFQHRVLLTAAAASHVLHYALLGAVLLQGSLGLALACWGLRVTLAARVLIPVAKRLKEGDLLPIFPLLDVGMALYWGLFTPLALSLGKPPKQWR